METNIVVGVALALSITTVIAIIPIARSTVVISNNSSNNNAVIHQHTDTKQLIKDTAKAAAVGAAKGAVVGGIKGGPIGAATGALAGGVEQAIDKTGEQWVEIGKEKYTEIKDKYEDMKTKKAP